MVSNSDVLTEYRDQRKKLDQLAAIARKAMQLRFTEVLKEAADIQSNYRTDFGVNPELPAAVKTFTLGDGKKKPAANGDAVERGHKIRGLRRSLNSAKANRDLLAAAGKPTAKYDERIAELADKLTAEGAAPEEQAAEAPEVAPSPVIAAPVVEPVQEFPDGDDGLDF